MNEFAANFGNYALGIGLFGLAIIGAFFALAATGAVGKLIRKWTGLSICGKAFVVLSFAFFVLTGATKSKFTFDGGIKANPSLPSWSSNETSTVSIFWQRDTSGGILVPTNSAVYIDYRECANTNGEWTLLATTTVGAWQWVGTVVNATNYDYNVWAYYIPPEPVHTNGVWVYRTTKDRRGESILPLSARVEVDGTAISTPDQKRKDATK